VFQWLQDLRRPDGLSDAEYATFVRYCTDFFVDENRLWCKNSHGAHKLVIPPGRRLDIIRITHDSLGHKAFYVTKARIGQHFWWPSMVSDVHWYTKTCHICQLRQTRQVLIPQSSPLLPLSLPKPTSTPCICRHLEHLSILSKPAVPFHTTLNSAC
jgi:hypothetical protein